MIFAARVHNHKAKLKSDINDDTFRTMQKPVTPENHKFMTSHFDVIKKHDQRTRKKGNIDYDKQAQGMKYTYKKKL